ncbi:hypothetical protein U1Q18_051809, partial [Sarracenia purpurea var. burkii]
TPIITLFPLGNEKVEQFDKAILLCHVEPSTATILKRRWFRDFKEFTPVTPDVTLLSVSTSLMQYWNWLVLKNPPKNFSARLKPIQELFTVILCRLKRNQ